MRHVLVIATLGLAGSAAAYPNGTLHYVTDMVPACASCHSILDAGTMPEAPAETARAELAANKHVGAIRKGVFPLYSELDEGMREALVREVARYDGEAEVSVSAPENAGRGEELRVEVKYKGGNGPVVGIMLVDRALRNQARPIQALGWRILRVAAQTSSGQDASGWFARRVGRQKDDLNFVLLPAVRTTPGPPPSGIVTFELRAPSEIGTYPVTAVFLYGTENTDRAGFFQRPSGRTAFSATSEVAVR